MTQANDPFRSGSIGSRRSAVRIAANHLTAVVDEAQVELEDLSAGGFAAMTADPFEAQAVHIAQFKLAAVKVTIRAHALHSREITNDLGERVYLTGFAFVGNARPGGSTVDDLLDALTSSSLSFDSV